MRPASWRSTALADLLIASATAITATCSISTSGIWFNIAALFSVAAILLVTLWHGQRIGAPSQLAIFVGLALTLVVQVIWQPSANVTVTKFFPVSVWLAIAAIAALLMLPLARSLRATYGVLTTSGLLALLALIITPLGGENPQIDVWVIFQDSAAGWLHGLNPYEMTFANVPPGQTNDCFNYLPVSFIASWPGWLTGGDVRYSELAILVAGWGALAYVIGRCPTASPHRRVHAWTILLFGVTLCGSVRIVQQAWNESLVLGFLLMGVALIVANKAGWAWIPFALALATKQHVALLLPIMLAWPAFGLRRTAQTVAGAVVILLPYLIWNFTRFKHCTVDFFLNSIARHDSISAWNLLPHSLQTPAVCLTFTVFLVLAIWRLPKNEGTMLIAFGAVQFGFDLFNKQSFENQWWLVSQLLVAGLALITLNPPPPDRHLAADSASQNQ